MVFGATTLRMFADMIATSTEGSEVRDPWVTRMWRMPATVVSTTLEEPLDWPNATVVRGDAVDVVARLKEESDVPLRSHGSLSMNRALMAAGLVDRLQVTLFPVITGRTGLDPIFRGRGRLRPRAARAPDARRQHPRAHLPTHPPLTRAHRKRIRELRRRGPDGAGHFALDAAAAANSQRAPGSLRGLDPGRSGRARRGERPVLGVSAALPPHPDTRRTQRGERHPVPRPSAGVKPPRLPVSPLPPIA